MRAWLAAAAVATLAGCAGASPASDGTAATSPTAGAEAGLALPTWRLHDYWTYAVGGNTTTYVVTAEQGSDWFLDTDSPERAFQDAREDISRLGPQRKSDLAGSQGSQRVEFFRWPLTDGKNWTTTWDRQPVSIAVRLEGDLARLEARDRNGTLVYRYTYDPDARWFGELRRFTPDGREAIALVLTEAGHGWSGLVVRYTLSTLYRAQGSNGGAEAKDLHPDPAATDLWLGYHVECGANGGYFVSLVPIGPGVGSDGSVRSGDCTVLDNGEAVPGPTSAPWTLSYSWGGPSAAGYSVEVLQRTRQDIPVP